MIERRKNTKGKPRYRVKIHQGGRRYKSIGTYTTRDEAKRAEALAIAGPTFDKVLVGTYCDTYLAWYRNNNKLSSYDQVRHSLKPFLEEFGHRQLGSITDHEAEVFAGKYRWAVPAIRTMFNRAVRKHVVGHNPFTGLVKPGRGRVDKDPLSVEQVDKLAQAAYDAHAMFEEWHRAKTLKGLVLFAAYTGVRQGEAFALEWRDVDFNKMRVRVDRRVYKGHVDIPKGGRKRLVVLPAVARDALLEMGRKPEGYVFQTKTGKRLDQSTFSQLYWPLAIGKYGEKVDFHELRHFAGHWLYVTNDMPSRLVAAQLGHSNPSLVETLYGHFKHGALDEIDRALGSVTTLRAVTPPESQGAG